MKRVFSYLACILIALFLGVGSALWAINSHIQRAWLQNKSWRVNLDIGGRTTGLYSRAAVARGGLFALTKSEASYYVAGLDDDGQPLTSDCDYKIEGKDMDARWWSITLYGADFFLIPNDKKQYSFNRHNVKRKQDGSYEISLSSTTKQHNWLPSGDQDQFYLTLRLYNPSKFVYENPGQIELPRITREVCR